MFYKQLCATRRTHPPVKTFRTGRAGVPRRWGKSRAALRPSRDGTGNKCSRMQFLGTEKQEGLMQDYSVSWDITEISEFYQISVRYFFIFLSSFPDKLTVI